jgi:hypothetical protein
MHYHYVPLQSSPAVLNRDMTVFITFHAAVQQYSSTTSAIIQQDICLHVWWAITP